MLVVYTVTMTSSSCSKSTFSLYASGLWDFLSAGEWGINTSHDPTILPLPPYPLPFVICHQGDVHTLHGPPFTHISPLVFHPSPQPERSGCSPRRHGHIGSCGQTRGYDCVAGLPQRSGSWTLPGEEFLKSM